MISQMSADTRLEIIIKYSIPISQMSIVGVFLNKIALLIRVGVDDWTAEKAIIASNDMSFLCCWLFTKKSIDNNCNLI